MRIVMILCLLLINVAATASGDTSNTKPFPVRVDSGTGLYAFTQEVSNNFKSSPEGTGVNVHVSQFGGGLKRLCENRADVAEGASLPSEEELVQCRKNSINVVVLPIAMDAVVLIVNPRNLTTKIDLNSLRKMWGDQSQEVIRRWEQVDASLPAQPLKLYGSPAKIFSSQFFSLALFGKPDQLRSDITVSADDGVLVRALERDLYGIGYVSYPYYYSHKNRLKALAIGNSSGKMVLPSPETIRDGSYKPFSRNLYLYVSSTALSHAETFSYVSFYIQNASRVAKNLQYIAYAESDYLNEVNNVRKYVHP
jgi:phosphate transport system substrate-binding protein